MLDYRCMIIPRFVYAVGDDFGDDRLETMYIANEEIQRRISELAQTTTNLTRALDGVDKGT
jgi:FMN reductase